MSDKVQWAELETEDGRPTLSEEQLDRVKEYMHLLVHPMNVESKVSSFARGRAVVTGDWLARDVLRAAEAELLPCTPDHPEVVAARERLDGDEPVEPVVLAILETSEHKLTILDGFETVCAAYAADAENGRVRAHLLRLPT